MTYLKRRSLSRDTLIVSMGFEPKTVEMLLTAGIVTLGDLIAHKESEVCHMLVEDDLGFGMSNELAENAVERFMRLRGRLDEFGYGFDGPRRTAYDHKVFTF